MSAETGIPTEILCEIFHSLCRHHPVSLNLLHNPTTQDFPWAVGQVCKRWRDAFISYPPLWISLSLRRRTRTSAAYLAEMNRRTIIYLERSGQLPLTISISLCHDTYLNAPLPTMVLGTLISCSYRWNKLTLSVISQSELDFFRAKVPILSYLSIYMDTLAMRNLHPDIIEVAPRLTELKLTDPVEIRGWNFPWAQLTKLSIDSTTNSIYSGDLQAFLIQLQNLETLTLCLISDATPPNIRAVRLARLQSFETTLLHPIVFSWFTAPLLEHLDIYDVAENDQESYNREILSLVNRSSCYIRRLTLEFGEIIVMSEMLKMLVHVEELVIKHSWNYSWNYKDTIKTPRFIGRIAESGNHIYLPKLRVLKIKYCPGHTGGRIDEFLSHLLEVRGKESRLVLANCDVVPLERLVLQLGWCTFCLNRHTIPLHRRTIPYDALKAIRRSGVEIYIDDSALKRYR
ncbi:hypothetical protein F5887DRAFT_1176962 [Amanita rubescens]|nr:hypothetical protein F5887DRAFT_1176962 [Amanita rubescens]